MFNGIQITVGNYIFIHMHVAIIINSVTVTMHVAIIFDYLSAAPSNPSVCGIYYQWKPPFGYASGLCLLLATLKPLYNGIEVIIIWNYVTFTILQ